MFDVSSSYKTAASNYIQDAEIKVEVGRFGIRQFPSEDESTILARFNKDDVQNCVVDGCIGSSGTFSIGSAEAFSCTLTMMTSSIKPYINVIDKFDIRVSYGYHVQFEYDPQTETITVPSLSGDGDTIYFDDYTVAYDSESETFTVDTVEWHVKGIFATDKSQISRNGIITDITMYDAFYWMDTILLGDGIVKEAGTPTSLHEMITAICDEYGIVLAKDALTVLPNTTLNVFRPVVGDGLRPAIGAIATAGFCNATMYDNKLHFVKPTALGITLETSDFKDIPSFDFCPSTVSQITAKVTETFEYSDDDTVEYIEPKYKIVRDDNKNVATFPGNKRKGKKYILYIYGSGSSIEDFDAATDAPWATVTYTGSGTYKGKTLLQMYNAGVISGTYITAGVHAVGHNAFNLKRYGAKVYMAGKNTGYFASSDETGAASFNTSAKVTGGTAVIDWAAMSELKGEDQEHTWSYPEDKSDDNTNVIEIDGSYFNGGTINSLKDDGAFLALAEADFAAIGANSGLPYTYYGASLSTFGRDFYTVGDVLSVREDDGVLYPLNILKATYTYNGAINSEYGCDGLTSDVAAAAYAGTGSTSAKLNELEDKTEIIGDKTDEAIEKAEEVIADANLAASLGDEAYDLVYPITSAMRTLLANAISEADKAAEGVLDEMQYTYVAANDFANAKAEFKSSNYRSAVRWTSTYTEEYDAWASDDAATQASIAAAKAKLDAANAALDTAYENEATAEADVASSMNELVRRIKALDKGKSDKNSLSSQLAAAKKNLAALKKNKKSKAKTIAAAQKLVNELQAQYDTAVSGIATLEANLAKAIYAVFGADGMSDVSGMIDQEAYDACAAYFADSTWLADMQSSYGDGSKAALVVAEQSVSHAETEVDTAINGIHGVRTSVIEQTAQGVKISASKVEALDTKVSQLDVKADGISTSVSTLDSKTQALMKATNMTQTDSGFTWTIVDNTARSTASSAASTASSALSTANSASSTANSAYNMSYDIINGTGTLSLGGNKTTITMGGSTSTINMCGSALKIYAESGGGFIASGSDGVGIHSGNVGMMVGSNAVYVTAFGSYVNGSLEATGEIRTTGAGTSTSTANCRLTKGNGPGYIRYATGSSRRFKHDIEDINADYLDPTLLYSLPVRQFIFNEDYIDSDDDRQGLYIPGFIAEEVAEHYPIAADLDAAEREFDNWNERLIIPGMLKLIQDQKKMIDALTARIDALEGK